MNHFIEQFSNLSTESLLEKRALGPDGLIPEAHAAVEQLLRGRGVPVPPMPSRSISVDASNVEPRRSVRARDAVLGIGALVAGAISNHFAVTWVGLLFSGAIGLYLVIEWVRRKSLSDSERGAEDARRQASREGLTELMQSAAAGDLSRVKELLAYGASVNAISDIGSTALMYAAKNGHVTVAQRLVEGGADTSIRTKAGNLAIDLARKAGHDEIVRLLERGTAQAAPRAS